MRTKIRLYGRDVPLVLVVIVGVLSFCAIIYVFLLGVTAAQHAHDVAMMEPVWGQEPEGLAFNFDTCGSEPGPYFEPYVESIDWVGEDTLHLLVAVPDNCAATGGLGNYRLEDEDQLILEYVTFMMAGEAACICRAELEFEVSGLERQDYSIDIEKIRKDFRMPMW